MPGPHYNTEMSDLYYANTLCGINNEEEFEDKDKKYYDDKDMK
jgi:hypothetical protein